MRRLPLIAKLLLILIGAVLLATLLLTAAFCLPEGNLRENAALSLYYLNSVEGIYYPHYFHSNPDALRIDNYTNHLMIEACLGEEGHGPLYNALNVQDYARYWHGYLLFLRPMLTVGTLELIRYVHMLILPLLFAGVFCLMARRLGMFIAAAFSLSLYATWFFLVPMSLQYAGVYYLTFLFLILILTRGDRLTPEQLSVLFFSFGILTSFLDLLTVPLLTLGFPLLTLLGLQAAGELPSGKPTLGRTIGLTCLWGLGYGGFWASKWILGSLALHKNVLFDAAKAALMRLNVSEYTGARDHYDRLTVILTNLKKLFPAFPSSFAAFGAAVLAVCLLFAAGQWLAQRKTPLGRIPVKHLLPGLLVSAYPFFWYCLLANHSGKHAFFTCKLLALTIFGGLLFLMLFLRGRGRALSARNPLQTGEKPI